MTTGERRYLGLWFAAPALLTLGAIILYPLIHTAALSLADESGAFAGLANFREALSLRLTWLALENTFVYVFGSLFFQMVLGTAAGILLNQRMRAIGLFRSLILIPWVAPGIVAATTWAWMLHGEFGIVNVTLIGTGLIEAPVSWLTERDAVMPALIAVNVWKMFPFVAVMVLAGLQAIPESLYEAARVDGSGFWSEVRHIMLPHLRPVFLSVGLLLLIWGLNGITIIYAMTRGGPANRTLITPIQIFKQAFELFNFNLAAALSILLFASVGIMIAVYVWLFRREEQA